MKTLKKNFGEKIVTITDVCLCQYTSHGHCGIIRNKVADNDESLKILDRIALSHAEAGADFVAPSAMMDGQVKSIRKALDNSSLNNIGIIDIRPNYLQIYIPRLEMHHTQPLNLAIGNHTKCHFTTRMKHCRR